MSTKAYRRSDEGLKMFSNLESKAIKIVLVGQPELDDKLNLGV